MSLRVDSEGLETPELRPNQGQEQEQATLGDGQVLLKHEYAAMIPFDTYVNDFGYITPNFPMIFGFSAAGTIVEVGSGVGDLKVGDKVTAFTYGESQLKGTQEYSVQPRHVCAKIPDYLSKRPAQSLTTSSRLSVLSSTQFTSPFPSLLHSPHRPPLLSHIPLSSFMEVVRAPDSTPSSFYMLQEVGNIVTSSTGKSDGKIDLVLDCISTETTLGTIGKFISPLGKLAILLPVKEGDNVCGDEKMNINPSQFPEKMQGLILKEMTLYGVRTFLCAANGYLRTKILPELLEAGIIKPNKIRLIDESSVSLRISKIEWVLCGRHAAIRAPCPQSLFVLFQMLKSHGIECWISKRAKPGSSSGIPHGGAVIQVDDGVTVIQTTITLPVRSGVALDYHELYWRKAEDADAQSYWCTVRWTSGKGKQIMVKKIWMSRSIPESQTRSTGDDRKSIRSLPPIYALRTTDDWGTIRLELQRIQGDVKLKKVLPISESIHDSDAVDFVLEDQRPSCVFVFRFERMKDSGNLGEQAEYGRGRKRTRPSASTSPSPSPESTSRDSDDHRPTQRQRVRQNSSAKRLSSLSMDESDIDAYGDLDGSSLESRPSNVTVAGGEHDSDLDAEGDPEEDIDGSAASILLSLTVEQLTEMQRVQKSPSMPPIPLASGFHEEAYEQQLGFRFDNTVVSPSTIIPTFSPLQSSLNSLATSANPLHLVESASDPSLGLLPLVHEDPRSSVENMLLPSDGSISAIHPFGASSGGSGNSNEEQNPMIMPPMQWYTFR
ncbi:hypothetical protein D9758_009696 [Tetrapyrgos nigripes]|uniref:Alcohol dehydrogenase-like N-terminal domain-containing protein n=1 Tax=Tetrapyrgos nigripes TaxID=182062 RepID=A0A8H5CQE9_9AGAR|nr:hypothetical protein D9758_009696 [Tetrapyrgos nigripes]